MTGGVYLIQSKDKFCEFTEEARRDFYDIDKLDLISIADDYLNDKSGEIVDALKNNGRYVISYEQYDKEIAIRVLLVGFQQALMELGKQ